MEIVKIGDWTCSKCKSLLTLEKENLHCDGCNKEATLKDLFGQDLKNIYFNGLA